MEENWIKRPWYEWIGWAVWLAITILFLQTAIASGAEVEPQAAMISFALVAVLLAFAIVIWGRRILGHG